MKQACCSDKKECGQVRGNLIEVHLHIILCASSADLPVVGHCLQVSKRKLHVLLEAIASRLDVVGYALEIKKVAQSQLHVLLEAAFPCLDVVRHSLELLGCQCHGVLLFKFL